MHKILKPRFITPIGEQHPDKCIYLPYTVIEDLQPVVNNAKHGPIFAVIKSLLTV